MAHYVIDLMGDDNDDDVIVLAPEETAAEIARKEAMRKQALYEIFKRAPQPDLQIVPTDPGRRR